MTKDNPTQPSDGLGAQLKRLYPAPAEMPLPGLYLCEDLRALIPAVGAFVYANFIVSLDGPNCAVCRRHEAAQGAR